MVLPALGFILRRWLLGISFPVTFFQGANLRVHEGLAEGIGDHG